MIPGLRRDLTERDLWPPHGASVRKCSTVGADRSDTRTRAPSVPTIAVGSIWLQLDSFQFETLNHQSSINGRIFALFSRVCVLAGITYSKGHRLNTRVP